MYYYNFRQPKKDGPNQRVVPFVNPAYEPLPSFMKPPTRYPAGSVMSPASVFAPRGPASHTPSMSGYTTGGCLFYEEPDDEPVRTGGYAAPSQGETLLFSDHILLSDPCFFAH